MPSFKRPFNWQRLFSNPVVDYAKATIPPMVEYAKATIPPMVEYAKENIPLPFSLQISGKYYSAVINSFKENIIVLGDKHYTLSTALEKIREQFVKAIQSPYFNKETRDLLAGVNTCRFYYCSSMPELETLFQQNKIEYLNNKQILPNEQELPQDIKTAYFLTNNTLYYVYREANDRIKVVKITDDETVLTELKHQLTVEEFNIKKKSSPPEDQSDFFVKLKEAVKKKFDSDQIKTKLVKNILSKHERNIITRITNFISIETENCGLYVFDSLPKQKKIPADIQHAFFLINDETHYFHRKHKFFIKVISGEQTEQLKKALQQEYISPTEPSQKLEPIYSNLPRKKKKIITKLTYHAAEEYEPFSDFKTQPKQIIQIKEIINALYHAQLGINDLAQLDLEKKISYNDLKKAWKHTKHHLFTASMLLTHLDINLVEVFQEEINDLVKVFSFTYETFNRFLETDEANQVTNIIKNSSVNQAGRWAGIAVNQLGVVSDHLNTTDPSKKKKTDFGTLTKFVGDLPGYLQTLTKRINEYTSSIEFESTLDKKKIEALKDSAIELLGSIQNLQNNNALLTFKVIKYINILRQIYSLIVNILEQMHYLTDSSQDFIREKLSQLKYDYLPRLFTLSDKIEDELLLEAGTLSLPLGKKVIPLYQSIIKLASKPVDFSVKGEELLTLEDPRFIEERVQQTQNRINIGEQELFRIVFIEQKFKLFFKLLEDKEAFQTSLKAFNVSGTLSNEELDIIKASEIQKLLQEFITNGTLSNESLSIGKSLDIEELLPLLSDIENFEVDNNSSKKEEIINKLEKIYDKKKLTDEKFIKISTVLFNYLQPYFEKYYIELSNNVARELLVNKLSNDSIKKILSTKNHFDNLLKSEIATINFHKKANITIINNIYNKADIILRPYTSKNNRPYPPNNNRLIFNEVEVLKFDSSDTDLSILKNAQHTVIKNIKRLSWEESITLYIYHQEKIANINLAKSKFSEFLSILEKTPNSSLDSLPNETKKQLKNLYLIFQPYFVEIFINDRDATAIKDLDKTITQSLQLSENSLIKPDCPLTLENFVRVKGNFESNLAATIEIANSQSEIYQNNAKQQFILKHQHSELKPHIDLEERAHYVLKTQKLSTIVSLFKNDVFSLKSFFNPIVQKKLTYQENGTPFPEVEIALDLLSQEEQIVNIKRLFNSIYHLEEICKKFEDLRDDDYQWKYVEKLYYIYEDIFALIQLTQQFQTDPHMSIFFHELHAKALSLFNTVLLEVEPYTEDSTDAVEVKGQVEINSIWSSVLAFMLIPEHIKALKYDRSLTLEELHEIRVKAKKHVINIEEIIASSDSYFKLLLKTPKMYSLFKEFKLNLGDFTNISYEEMMNNLGKLNTEIFAKILIETDEWEDKLGLKYGTLSDKMKKILDEFYQGLLEPLGLISYKHIACVITLDVFEKRKEANQHRRRSAQANKKMIQVKLGKLKELSLLMKSYEEFSAGSIIPSKILNEIKQKILVLYEDEDGDGCDLYLMSELPKFPAQYKNSYLFIKKNDIQEMYYIKPDGEYEKVDIVDFNLLEVKINAIKNKDAIKLHLSNGQIQEIVTSNGGHTHEYEDLKSTIQKKAFLYTPVFPPPSTRFVGDVINDQYKIEGNLINDYFKKNEKKEFYHLPHVVDAIYHYYLGLDKTFQLEIEITEKKDAYLKKREEKQIKLNNEFQLDYIKKTFEKRNDIISADQTAIHHLKLEYKEKLKNYLFTFEKEITESALENNNIKKHVKACLKEKTKQFEHDNLKYYHQLDKAISAIRAFGIYIDITTDKIDRNKYTLYEDKNSLRKKGEQLDVLEQIAMNPKLSAEERVKQLRAEVSKTSFVREILQRKNVDLFTPTWFLCCALALLQALHLYTPSYIKHYERLVATIDAKQTRKFGFFSTNDTNYDNSPLDQTNENNNPLPL